MKTQKEKSGFTPLEKVLLSISGGKSVVGDSITQLHSSSVRRRSSLTGFTITELLTVMSIIALLLGILVPALNMVRRIAKDTRQKAQFHSISIAMEAFAGETEEYPPSAVMPDANTTSCTVGAQHLAEALLGRDFLGFDPWSTWDTDADYAGNGKTIYANDDKGSAPVDINDCMDRRIGPYLNPESVEAYQVGQLYGDTGDVYTGNYADTGLAISGQDPAPVLTDSYRVKTVLLPNKKLVKAGSPILYYKANTLSKVFPDFTSAINPAMAGASIYSSLDNEALLEYHVITDGITLHHFDPAYKSGTGRQVFYEAITNPKVTTQDRPYNQSSYILISAGFDSVFGTPDDIYNFNE